MEEPKIMKVIETTTVYLDKAEIDGAIRAYLLAKGFKTKRLDYNIEEFTDNNPSAKLVGVEIDAEHTTP